MTPTTCSPILSGTDYLSLPRDPETWLIKPLLPTSGAAILYGDPKVGKSYAALQLALALRTGEPWLGFQIPQAGPVVYIQLDTPRSLWTLRLDELGAAGHAMNLIHYADRETIGVFPFDILNPEHKSLLIEALKPLKAVAVVMDTIREAHSADENDSTAMRNVIGELVAATQPAALVLISHSRKPSQDGGYDLLADQRGSGYVVGRMDCILRMTKKSLYFTGRGIEEGSIRISREETGFWAPETAELDIHILNVLSDKSLTTTRARAKALAILIGKSEEACRSLLRRYESGS